jgi:hypothetical protein
MVTWEIGRSMMLRTAVKSLLVLVLALPVVVLVLLWTGGLLRAMGDDVGATVVRCVATVCQAIWAVGLVGLLVTLALHVVSDEPPIQSPLLDEIFRDDEIDDGEFGDEETEVK